MPINSLQNYTIDRAWLTELAPAGWVLSFNYTAAGAEKLDSTMPAVWQEAYVRGGVFLDDPVFRWIVKEQSGATRWSEIDLPDSQCVLKAAAAHGMRYGMAATRNVNSIHSFISLSRADREFSDSEVREVTEKFFYWVDLLHNRASLTDGEIAVLECLRDGLSQVAAAERLGVSLPTIKYRSQQAQDKLKARTSTQAVSIAKDRGFI
ncbi:autoinducer binding domain-containing protein [Paracoccus sp. FO-3]|uniref:helix-turn-helix transcriptional regulator n=1 Tax=Paracoccus sp. FO-3 TaxID=1335059 RepID=UPI00112B3086|nr:autoinducer binding domain-containing protein [Paracoccus sp. FO-3]